VASKPHAMPCLHCHIIRYNWCAMGHCLEGIACSLRTGLTTACCQDKAKRVSKDEYQTSQGAECLRMTSRAASLEAPLSGALMRSSTLRNSNPTAAAVTFALKLLDKTRKPDMHSSHSAMCHPHMTAVLFVRDCSEGVA
jgi:hypothetical protein